jgi:hypothetical protein
VNLFAFALLPKVPIKDIMVQKEIDMSAFLDGFFSIFRCPFFVPGVIMPLDWDEDLLVVKPSGDIEKPPDTRSVWAKVDDYLRTAMSEYERNIQQ